MGKATKKSHKCQSHEECRRAVCFLCLRKGDGRGISKSMEDFILKKSICNDFLFDRPYLPGGSCSTCRNHVANFFKNGKPVTLHSSNDYIGIANELRNLPVETRNPASKLNCHCQICQIARSKGVEPKEADNHSFSKESLEKCTN